MTEITTLYCGKCRELLPKRELKLDRKLDAYVCSTCYDKVRGK